MIRALTQHPPLFSWAGNDNSYRLWTDSLASGGTRARYTVTFGSLANAGAFVVVELDGVDIYIRRRAGVQGVWAYGVTRLEELARAILSDYRISDVFTGSYDAGQKQLLLHARREGRHSLAFRCLNRDGSRNYWETQLVLNIDADNGSDPERLPNYAVAARLKVAVNRRNLVDVCDTGFLVFHPDSDGYVDIPLRVLRGYFPDPDLPGRAPQLTEILTNALLSYRLEYCEMFGDPPHAMPCRTDAPRWAFCGAETPAHARVDLPDWESGGVQFAGGDGDRLLVIGEEDGRRCVLYGNQPVYLYLFRYDPSREVGEMLFTNFTTRTYTRIPTLNHTHSVTNGHIALIHNGGVTRLRLDPATQAGGYEGGGFHIEIEMPGGGRWQRDYTVLPYSHRQRTLLLQNGYGLVVPYACRIVEQRVASETEDLLFGEQRLWKNTSSADLIVVETPPLADDGLRDAKSFLSGGRAWLDCAGEWIEVCVEGGETSVCGDGTSLRTLQLNLRPTERAARSGRHAAMGRVQTPPAADSGSTLLVGYDDSLQPNKSVEYGTASSL